jgi:hypothetical protein
MLLTNTSAPNGNTSHGNDSTNQEDEDIELQGNDQDTFFTPLQSVNRSQRLDATSEQPNASASPVTPVAPPLRSRLIKSNKNKNNLQSRKEEILHDVLEKYTVKRSKNTNKDVLSRPSPSKAGEFVRLGAVEEVGPIIDYLLSDGTIEPPRKGSKRNNKLTTAVADVLLRPKYFDLTDEKMSQEYPVLDMYSYAKVALPQPISSSPRGKKRKSGTRTSIQVGQGIVSPINYKSKKKFSVSSIDFNRWNKLVHKY